ncbi:hypothetical protein CANARDRAFT_29676 [[Candida] arabinofermentans NRRL YB-2248]|uniref:Membrane protein PTM1 n=1 Tax=[Candida] arabinofermentans NRRL YB-2248 TaxID=983967 RepID=A0A1E4SVZ5_9ASCO|nr:hypothetical protein CANARDRAFT_29676 [[Candida] arabinofermentans NRRL YB-2248]
MLFINAARWALISVLSATAVLAQKTALSAKAPEYCTGMYSKIDWGGPTDPFIKVDLKSFATPNPQTGNASISLIVFEHRDLDRLGYYDNTTHITHYICTEELIDGGVCSKEELNEFIVNQNTTYENTVKSVVLTDLGVNDFSYHVAKTGYYCVAAYNPVYDDSDRNDFKLVVNFHNAYGNLAASEIPKLPMYGLLAVVYAVCLGVYLFQVFKHRSELLLLQKYLAGFFVFLTIENILVWSLYDVRNNSKAYPTPAGIKFYTFFISCLNAFKISFSLFLLLIISLGYGVVYPKLARKTMFKCKILAVAHFIFSVAFIYMSYYTSQALPETTTTNTTTSSDSLDSSSWIFMIVTFPLAILLVVFYFYILSSQQKTVRLLQENKQIVKLNMYKKLFRLIFSSMLLMVFASIISMVIIFNDSLTDSIDRLWKFNEVLTDLWPSIIYFIVFIGLAIIWRPTDTSYLLAASTQIPTAEGVLEDPENPEDQVDIYNNLEQYGNEFEFDDLRSLESQSNPFQDPSGPSSSNVARSGTSENPFADAEENKTLDVEFEKQKASLKSSASNDNFHLDDDDDEDFEKAKKKD